MPRLHLELQSVSFKQKVQSMQADMAKMSGWCSRFQDDANRQGALDVKYASDRYTKGITKVEEFMKAKHRVVVQEDFSEAHAHIVNMSHSMGSDEQPLLGEAAVSYMCLNKFNDNDSCLGPPRPILLVLDLTCFPTSVLGTKSLQTLFFSC